MTTISDSEMEKMMKDLEVGGASTDAALTEPSVAPAAPSEQPVSATKPKMQVKVGNETMLNRFVDQEQAKKDIAINPNDLDSEMLEHASLYLHYAQQTVNARRQYDRLKNAFEILEARLDEEYRTSMSEGAAKKPTEAQIRAAIVSDKRWSGAQAKVIEANSIWRSCEIVESAMSQRRDMILEVARDRRKDKEGQLRVLENQDMRDRVHSLLAERKTA